MAVGAQGRRHEDAQEGQQVTLGLVQVRGDLDRSRTYRVSRPSNSAHRTPV
jgi:hypothetical protein